MAKADYACCLSCDCKVIYAPDWEGQGYVYCEDCGEKRAAKLARVEALPEKWRKRTHNWRDQDFANTDACALASGRDIQDDECAKELEAALKDTP